ncbi:CPXCG motif-containing cysteine-rich protein [Winogradskyella aurantiaca]|uniref:CPXCG motif-containing cysteine-rich protein n=1 Tax=Winogradskyella aurantiaca TaxID=2219558 RepID=UPI000E1D3FEA|nr:CPXCG motif-containing cysteine-rich protein [Winogradskyella aurantiaca]
MEEQFFQCPHCWETISMLVDVSIEQQQYVEDCEVCCNPIEISISIEDGNIGNFQANSIEQ